MSKTIYETFLDSVKRNPERIALKYKKDGQYMDITYKELSDSIDVVASALKKLEISKGDTVAIFSYNRPEWVVADLAVLKLGGVVVPIYHMPGHVLPPTSVKYILNDSKIKLIFVENAELFSVIEQIRNDTPGLRKVVLFDHSKAGEKDFVKFADMKKTEYRVTDEGTALSCDDLATIVYTSGTTGEPKGVMLTHKNIIFNTLSACEKYHFAPEDVVISYLPLAHIFERACGYYTVLFSGGCIGYATELTTVVKDIKAIRPTIVIAVPRVLEKAYNTAIQKVEGSSAIKRVLLSAAIRSLNEYANRKYRKLKVPLGLKIKCWVYNRLVASKFKKLAGGRTRLIVSGGAPLNRQIVKIFYILGFNIVEGYGLTETSGVVTCCSVEENRLGTVGKPFDGVDVRIGENDEMLVRGPNVMKGYFNKPEETAKVIDKDGWFHTGDQGKFDKQGNLVITGRIKELIITSGGKKIAPAPIEANITMSRYIDQAVLHGDKRNYLVGLVVPIREIIEEHARENNITFDTYSTLLEREEIKELIKGEIERAISGLASYQRIKAFALLEEAFSVENGMLTPSLKLRRRKVEEKYCTVIDAMYSKGDSLEQRRLVYFH